MKLKTIEVEGATYAEVKDGKPVYVDGDKEIAVDVEGTVAKVSQLNHEAMERRRALDEATTKLKAFEGIDDPAAARKAMETVANIDGKKLIDAGEAEKWKAAIAEGHQAEMAKIKAELEATTSKLYEKTIGHSFATSPLISEKLVIPPDMARDTFGKYFALDGDKIVAKDEHGNTLYSRSNPGDVAGFEEALDYHVSRYPHRDRILKGSGASGSGATGAEGGSHGAKQLTAAAFDALPAKEKAAKMAAGYEILE